MRIVVTGAAGFIGFHVARSLLADGHSILGIDSFNDYYSVTLKQDRHTLLESSPGYEGLHLDVAEHVQLRDAIDRFAPDAVCHLAAQAGVRHSLDHPFVYQRANLEGFLSVLEACRHARPQPRLVYASSSSVYGGNKKMPFSEGDPVDTPLSLYAATKRANELMAHSYVSLYGMQAIGLRFFSVYGPWGRPDMAMWLFTERMLAGKPIQLFNHGKMKRDFTYIDDIVSGVKAAAQVDSLNQYEVINLGNHRCEELLELVGILATELGVEPELEMLPMQPGDVPAAFADIAQARKKLNFSPETPISLGVPQFVRWYQQYHGLRVQST